VKENALVEGWLWAATNCLEHGQQQLELRFRRLAFVGEEFADDADEPLGDEVGGAAEGARPAGPKRIPQQRLVTDEQDVIGQKLLVEREIRGFAAAVLQAHQPGVIGYPPDNRFTQRDSRHLRVVVGEDR